MSYHDRMIEEFNELGNDDELKLYGEKLELHRHPDLKTLRSTADRLLYMMQDLKDGKDYQIERLSKELAHLRMIVGNQQRQISYLMAKQEPVQIKFG